MGIGSIGRFLALLVLVQVALSVLLPTSDNPLGLLFSLLSSVAPSVAVSGLQASSARIAVTASSSDAKSFMSSPLHSAHSSLLSSV